MKFWCLQISPKANQILDRFLPYEARTEICQKFGWRFLGDLKTPKFHSEINWPLRTYCPNMYTLCLWVSLDIWKHWVNCLPLPPHEPKSPQLRRRRRFVHSALLQPNGAILLTLWHLLINHCTVAILIVTPKKLQQNTNCTKYVLGIREKLVLTYRRLVASTKGHLNSEWIYEVTVFSKIPTKNYRDFCPNL